MSHRAARRFASTVLLVGAPLAQGAPSFLADLHPGPDPQSAFGAVYEPGVRLGSNLIVPGSDAIHGSELWSTDGTAGGTRLVRDIAPGPRDADPANLVLLGGFVYFTADDGARGMELWRTDGTAAGTTLVKDIDPAVRVGSAPSSLMVSGSTLYFSADDGVNGRELWKSDGTAAGTVLVADIRAGSADSMLASTPIVLGRRLILGVPVSVLLFAADDGVAGRELWESRGTAATTLLRSDIWAGATGSSPQGLVAFSGHVMFSADDVRTGREPYHIRDGAPTLIADLNAGGASSTPADFTPVSISGSPRFFFAASNATYGREVFFWDTAASAGDLLHDIHAGTGGSNPDLLAFGSMLLISAENPLLGRELWRTDAPLTGAVLLRSFQSGPAGGAVNLAGVLSTSPPRALLGADDGVTGLETWVTDGTVAGTVQLIDATPPPTVSPPFLLGTLPGGEAVFAKYTAGRTSPLVTDGTPAGTRILAKPAGSTLPADPGGLTVFGSPQRALFAAESATRGRELWITDGTPAGTSLLKDIAQGSGDSSPADFVLVGTLCYFVADDGSSGREPWVTDGTAAGTRRLRDINPGAVGSAPSRVVEAGNDVFFWANDGSHGTELWRTDGTTGGTVMVADLVPGSSSGVYTSVPLVRVDSRVMFWSNANAAVGFEPWVSNGSAAGTTLLKDIEPGIGSSLVLSIGEALAVGNITYFRAYTTAAGFELWRTNGTASGTTLVMDLWAGSNSSQPRSFCTWGSYLYFLADGPGATTVLWGTSGSQITTAQVRSFARPPGGLLIGHAISALTAGPSSLVFAAWDAAHGFEPWISNGTFGGTVLLKDLVPGPVSGLPLLDDPLSGLRTDAWFFSLPGATRMVFPGTGGPDGIELWHTDGTTAGTVRHAELVPGPGSALPERPELVGTRLLFAADDPLRGNELHAMHCMGFSELFGLGCPGSSGRIPGISGSGAPFVGNAAFGIMASSARPMAPVILLVGFGPLDVPIGGGCSLYLDLSIPPLVLTGTTSASGFGVVGLPIPADQSLLGLQLWSQMDVIDPGAAFQGLLAVTGGLHTVVGPN